MPTLVLLFITSCRQQTRGSTVHSRQTDELENSLIRLANITEYGLVV